MSRSDVGDVFFAEKLILLGALRKFTVCMNLKEKKIT